MARPRAILLLMAADALALFTFVLAGVERHSSGTAPNVARTAGPLLLAWFAIATLVGTYRRPGLRTLALTWVAAVPAGAVLRPWSAAAPGTIASWSSPASRSPSPRCSCSRDGRWSRPPGGSSTAARSRRRDRGYVCDPSYAVPSPSSPADPEGSSRATPTS